MVARILILVLLCVLSVAAQTPPTGSTSTSAIIPRSYSETQPYPANETFTGTCTTGSCTITTSGATNFLTGDWAHLTGLTGDVGDVNDVTVNNIARTGTTVTLTLDSTTLLAATEKFYLEGAACAAIAGTWEAASASGTTITFTSIESGTIASTAVTCTANYAVQLTKTGASTLTFTKAGADGTITGGTLASTRMTPPEQGDTYTDSIDGTTVKVLMNASSGDSTAPCGNGEQMRNFHSTEDAYNLTGEYFFVIQNTNAHCVYSVATGAFVSRIGTGQGAGSAAKWSRRPSEP